MEQNRFEFEKAFGIQLDLSSIQTKDFMTNPELPQIVQVKQVESEEKGSDNIEVNSTQ